MATNLKTASVLAFERKLDPSDALFFSGDWNARDDERAWKAVNIREKSVRGTISNRLKTKDQDPAKLDAAIENPNLQTVDVCALPMDADTLKVAFSLRVLEGTGQPSACNDPAYRARLAEVVAGYVRENGFEEFVCCYACNLANGHFRPVRAPHRTRPARPARRATGQPAASRALRGRHLQGPASPRLANRPPGPRCTAWPKA